MAGDAAELDEIPRRNIETLRKLGRDGIVAMLKEIGGHRANGYISRI